MTCETLRHSEGFSACFRDDVKLLIKKWVSEGSLIHDVAESIVNYDVRGTKIKNVLHKSSYVELGTCFRMNKTDKLTSTELSAFCVPHVTKRQAWRFTSRFLQQV